MKIRCSSQLHEICYDGKSWYTPDCTEERLILNALEQSTSKCMAFMKAVRFVRDPYEAKQALRTLSIGNKELQKEFISWAHQREQKHNARKIQNVPAIEPGQKIRYQNVALTKLRGWTKGISNYFGPFTHMRVYLNDCVNVDDNIAFWVLNTQTIEVYIPLDLVKQIGPEKAYFENGVFYFPTRKGYMKYIAQRRNNAVFLINQCKKRPN